MTILPRFLCLSAAFLILLDPVLAESPRVLAIGFVEEGQLTTHYRSEGDEAQPKQPVADYSEKVVSLRSIPLYSPDLERSPIDVPGADFSDWQSVAGGKVLRLFRAPPDEKGIYDPATKVGEFEVPASGNLLLVVSMTTGAKPPATPGKNSPASPPWSVRGIPIGDPDLNQLSLLNLAGKEVLVAIDGRRAPLAPGAITSQKVPPSDSPRGRILNLQAASAGGAKNGALQIETRFRMVAKVQTFVFFAPGLSGTQMHIAYLRIPEPEPKPAAL